MAVCGGGLLALSHANLAGIATTKLTRATQRDVHIGAVHVSPGRWLTLDVNDLSIANIPGGRRPQMMTLGHLHARIRLTSLLHGPVETRDLVVTDFSGLFERTSDRTPNWRFGPPSQPGPDKPAPADTGWFPGMRDATIKGSDVTYCSANGHCYRVGLDEVALKARDDTAPLEITIAGSYNQVPVALTAHTGPIAVLRDAGKPYPATVHATSGDLTLDFDGTLTDLVDFDGVDGRFSLRTATAAPLMALAGETADTFAVSLSLNGQFIHKGDLWSVTQGKGNLGDNPIESANLTFTEGKSGSPDRLGGDMGFAKLDLNDLLPTSKGDPKPKRHIDLPVIAPSSPDPLLDLRLSARSLHYNELEFSSAAIALKQQPGRIDISSLQLGWLGATLRASGAIENRQGGSRIRAAIDVTGADIDRFRRQAGLAPVPVSGALSFRVRANADKVHTLNEASRKADVDAVVGMNSGVISQKVIDIASMNVGLLFRKASGTTPVTCLLGALVMRHGDGTVVPLRIYTSKGSIVGEAMFDLDRRWFELAFQSRTPGLLALDIPIRVSGPFDNPSIGLAGWSARGRALLKAARTANALPAGLEDFSAGKACL
ncbi:hypothetical protein Tasa_046_018 [Tanticharoenia sakaeratensis NBRC 103193]|uniref:Uncharacterized protein n=1 Tax=Tanticharoenia sakaeratensis NBRC 103193 TaxID=1231623 RepID=A0A0D6MPI0_9PROT|nr:AsmA-like C-terminal region-containing protein [Tanticharoenia sakaeratensis]GAN55336.1 hypothetical protein Tasa_046_018 [Tanticharoenia sakaeratensis NBRC 103193]